MPKKRRGRIRRADLHTRATNASGISGASCVICYDLFRIAKIGGADMCSGGFLALNQPLICLPLVFVSVHHALAFTVRAFGRLIFPLKEELAFCA